MSDLEERLRSWFASEVDRAERDLAAAKVGTTRMRWRTPTPGIAFAGLLVALVVLAVAVRPNVVPDTGKGPVRSPANTAPAGDPVLGPDGIPAALDGEPVLDVARAVRHAQEATTDEPFLAGGWWLNSGARCAFNARRVHPLMSICGDDSIQSGPRFESDGLAVTSPDLPVYDGPIVARVHTRDPRAASCPAGRRERCMKAVVVDEVLWRPRIPVIMYRAPDGLPTDVAGEGTYRAADLGAFRLEPGAFLVAGWAVGGDTRPCPDVRIGPSIPVPPTQCASSLLANERHGSGLLTPDIPVPVGPVVLRVRLGPEAACPAGYECPATLPRVTVEELVWAGDAVTSSNPLASENVYGVLRSELGDVWVDVQAGPIRPGGCDPQFPASTWLAGGTQAVGYLLVFPTIATREAGDANFRVDGFNGIGADGEPCRVTDVDGPASRWVAVDNVLVQVFADEELARRIEKGLEAIAP